MVINEPVRRWRVTGTDLLPRFAEIAPLDVFGMKVAGLAEHLGLPADRLTSHDDLPQHRMHAELARRRAYLHLCRWTSLGLSLIEAMSIGMPVVALAATEAAMAVPPGAGALSTRLDTLLDAARRFVDEPADGTPGGRAGPRRRPGPLRPRPFPRRLGPAAGGGSMRIAMISEHASPLAVLGGEDAGGQNTHVAELSAALAAAGHDVRVYTRRDAVGPAGDRTQRRTATTWCTSRPGRPSRSPRTPCCRTCGSSAAGWSTGGGAATGCPR